MDTFSQVLFVAAIFCGCMAIIMACYSVGGVDWRKYLRKKRRISAQQQREKRIAAYEKELLERLERQRAIDNRKLSKPRESSPYAKTVIRKAR